MYMKDASELMMFDDYLLNKGLADSTVDTYSKAVEQYIRFAKNTNTLEDINEFLIKVMVRSNKRGTFYYAALKHYVIFKFGLGEGTKMVQKMLKPENRDPKKITHYFSMDDRLKIVNKLNDINKKHYIIALIQMTTGVRIGDIVRMETGSISIETSNNKEILRLDIIGKGQKKKSTYITNDVIKEIVLNFISTNLGEVHSELDLRNNPIDKYYYFLEPIVRKGEHTFYTRVKHACDRYRKSLKTAMIQTGLDHTKFSSHDWRRCFSRDNYDEFKDIVILKNVLGHADIRTTERYLRHSGLNTREILEKMQN